MISIIVPVYKNYEMFFKNLRLNKQYFKDCEVIIMNDYPQEKIANKVKQILPQAIAYDNEINLGFGSNVNSAVKKTSSEYIFLLNSDVILNDDSFKKSITEFKKDKSLFALSFAQYESDGSLVGSNMGFFKDGLIYHNRKPPTPRSFSVVGSEVEITDTRPTEVNFWAEGGSSIFRKDLFVKFGGFDSLYNPFYWEDVDLSYRAWKSGYKIFYFPKVKVQHYHESTIGKYFQKSSVLKIVYRNQFIFNWKNLSDREFILKHLLHLPLIFIKSLLTGNWVLIQGFLLAVMKLPKIINTRKNTIKSFKKSDKDILDQFTNE